jgi:hypothetical protein
MPTKEDTDTVSESSAKIVDDRALAAAKEKIAALSEEIAEINENPSGNPVEDLEEKAARQEEVLKYKNYISDATRPGGGRRRFDTANENVRKNVQKNIRYALGRIRDECPDLEPFLNNKTIRTGKECCYSPDPENTPRLMLYKPTN